MVEVAAWHFPPFFDILRHMDNLNVKQNKLDLRIVATVGVALI